MMIKFVSVLSEICDSYLDNDGLNPVNAAQVHCDISEGLGLPAPSQGRVEPEIEINIHTGAQYENIFKKNGAEVWRMAN